MLHGRTIPNPLGMLKPPALCYTYDSVATTDAMQDSYTRLYIDVPKKISPQDITAI